MRWWEHPGSRKLLFFDDGNVAEGDRVGALALWQNSLRGKICFVQNLSIRAVVFAFFQHRNTEKHHWLHYSVKKYGWWTDHHKTSLVMIIKHYSVMLNHKKSPDVWWCLMLKSEAWQKTVGLCWCVVVAKPLIRSALRQLVPTKPLLARWNQEILNFKKGTIPPLFLMGN